MDYIALAGVNCFLKRRKKLRRLLVVSLTASVGSLLIHIYILNVGVRTILLHFGLNTVMNGLAFGWKDKKCFLENWFCIYLTVLFLGGIMEWESSLGIPINFFWTKAVIACLLLTGVTICFTRKKDFMKRVLKVDVVHHGKTWELIGYWDSGNLLCDPYNGKPVNILQAKLAEQIFSEPDDHMRLIPYCSLGNTNGLLSVCNVEKMYIYQGNERFEVEPAVIGVAGKGLLEEKEYEMILQASILEGAETLQKGRRLVCR